MQKKCMKFNEDYVSLIYSYKIVWFKVLKTVIIFEPHYGRNVYFYLIFGTRRIEKCSNLLLSGQTSNLQTDLTRLIFKVESPVFPALEKIICSL